MRDYHINIFYSRTRTRVTSLIFLTWNAMLGIR